MKTAQRRRLLRVLLKALVTAGLLLFALSFTSCRTQRVALQTSRDSVAVRLVRDTVRLVRVERDTALLRDSVSVDRHTAGDTVYVTTYRERIRQAVRTRTDTIYKVLRDTVLSRREVQAVERAVEARARLSLKAWAVIAAAVAAALALLWTAGRRGR